MPVDDNRIFLTVETGHTGFRFDRFVASVCECSRSQASTWIRNGFLRLDGACRKPSTPVTAGATVTGHLPADLTLRVLPEPLPLKILFEDEYLLVINKPPAMVTHPAPGHTGGTLVNGLLHYCPAIGTVGDPLRPGIVHRLDRDTSGVLMAAKTSAALGALSAMFQTRKIAKTYFALLYGKMKTPNGRIALPIGRHARQRKKMTSPGINPREAESLWKVRREFTDASLVEIRIITGRTHQIRVHCAALGKPVVGDRVYGGKWTKKKKHFAGAETFALLQSAPRQMLHSWRLAFTHPVTGRSIILTAPLPPDFITLLRQLRSLSSSSRS